MNTKDAIAFLGSLSSKICHDIVAPVSAVDMGISLLDDHLDDNLKSDPAYALLKDSMDKTLRRINFFRYAFAFGKEDTPPTHEEFIEHCQNACLHYKIKFVLDGFTPPSSQTAFLLRISACILYLVLDILPKGGTISMSISANQFTYEAKGPVTLMPPALDRISQNIRESFRAQNILPELIMMGLKELGMELTLQRTESSVLVVVN